MKRIIQTTATIAEVFEILVFPFGIEATFPKIFPSIKTAPKKTVIKIAKKTNIPL